MPDRPARQSFKRQASGYIPPWIRKRIQHENEIIERAESIGLEPPPRLGTKENDKILKSVTDALVEQEKQRRIKAQESAPLIPF